MKVIEVWRPDSMKFVNTFLVTIPRISNTLKSCPVTDLALYTLARQVFKQNNLLHTSAIHKQNHWMRLSIIKQTLTNPLSPKLIQRPLLIIINTEGITSVQALTSTIQPRHKDIDISKFTLSKKPGFSNTPTRATIGFELLKFTQSPSPVWRGLSIWRTNGIIWSRAPPSYRLGITI